ncbi:uncharacterized protein LOC141720137 [Apium graveolens]|uniref:uncharacterized protein LOC141720137 n=1 Tax=Apium graveolens TaxID=4045 RepID=UPI003D78EE44
MRLDKGNNEAELEELRIFAKWVLDIGDGKMLTPVDGSKEFLEDDIEVPPHFYDLESDNFVDKMIKSTYPNFTEKCRDPTYLSERAILTPTNQTVGHVNDLIVKKLQGESVSYFSVDQAEEFGTEDDLNSAFPVEHLNSINIPGLPPHDLKLKVRQQRALSLHKF